MQLRQTFTRSNSGVFEQSLLAVQQWFVNQWDERVADPPLPVHLGSRYNRGDQGISIQVERQPSEALPMPNMVIVPVVSTTHRVGWNNFALGALGVPTGRINGGVYERREKLSPIEVGLGVKFSCVDPNEGFMFDRICKENTPNAQVVVEQQSTGHLFKLTLTPDEQVNYPADGASGDNSDRIDIMTTFILRTYVGSSELNRLITGIRYGLYDRLDAKATGQTALGGHDTDGYRVPEPGRLRALKRR